MKYNELDKEYYVMSMDGANNHPMLAWGSIDFAPFLKAQPVDENLFELPLKLIFDEPYPAQYEMADLLMLASIFGVSEQFKKLFEEMDIYGVQFVSAEIKSNKGDIIKGHSALHIWNKLPAIDKDNYEGSPVNRFGNILSLSKFSLNSSALEEIDLEKRLIFGLSENSTMYLVHKTIYEAITAANLTGVCFFRVDEWDEDAMFS